MLDELEAALRANWDRSTLAVYADELQQRGELRGELIIIDLEIEARGPLAELVARRTQLLTAWLATLPPGKVVHGFLDVDATGADPLDQLERALASPGAPFIRTIAVAGPCEVHRAAVAAIAREPRSQLVRLVLRQWQAASAPTIDEAAWASLCAATPNLLALEFDGHSVGGDVVHPNVQHLRTSGWGALGSFISNQPTARPWPNVSAFDFAFVSLLQKASVPKGRFCSPDRFPALRELDVSRNEPGSQEPIALGGDQDVFAVISDAGIVAQLTALNLPTIRTQRQFEIARELNARGTRLERFSVRGQTQVAQVARTDGA